MRLVRQATDSCLSRKPRMHDRRYVAQHQLRNAKQVLLADQSVRSIAYSLGFASPSSFSSAFRRATGQTPDEFRRGMHR